MEILKRNYIDIPSFFEELRFENRTDVSNYENFSMPAVNIADNLSKFVIEIAAPGLEKENFTIQVDDKLLTVSATVPEENNENENSAKIEGKYTRKEFDFNKFTRSFSLPKEVNKENIKAAYLNGVLEITLEKIEKPKKIKRMVEIS